MFEHLRASRRAALRPRSCPLQAADALHFIRGRESEIMKHPYMALLRQFLLDLLPRPASAAQAAAGGSPAKGARVRAAPCHAALRLSHGRSPAA